MLGCLLLAAACGTAPEAQTPTPAPSGRSASSGFDSSRAYEHLRQVVALGPRPAGSPAIERTREYITAQLTSVGVSVVRQPFVAKTPVGDIQMVNLIATIPGSRQDRIAITGHYDTKLFREFPFVGANDGGSSTAFLIEMARVLKARQNALTIDLIFFDGEEATLRDWGLTDHTYGSQYYVDSGRRAGTLTGLKAMVLVDMIADKELQIYREVNSMTWPDTRPLVLDLPVPERELHLHRAVALDPGVRVIAAPRRRPLLRRVSALAVPA